MKSTLTFWFKLLGWKSLSRVETPKAIQNPPTHIGTYVGKVFDEDLIRDAIAILAGSQLLFSMYAFRKTTGLYGKSTYRNVTVGSGGLKGGELGNDPKEHGNAYPLTDMESLARTTKLLKQFKAVCAGFDSSVQERMTLTHAEKDLALEHSRRTPSIQGCVVLGTGAEKYNANKEGDADLLRSLIEALR